MPVNRGPSFARYNSAIAVAAAHEAARAEKAQTEREQATELPRAEARRTPTDLRPEQRQDVA
jgi:hypothetical protein